MYVWAKLPSNLKMDSLEFAEDLVRETGGEITSSDNTLETLEDVFMRTVKESEEKKES